MLVELNRITVPPGQRVLLSNVSWQEFEAILEDLGEHRASRVAYDNGTLEIMTPLPEHETNKELVSDLGRNKTMRSFRGWVREQIASC